MDIELGGVDSLQSFNETRSPEQMPLGMHLDPNVSPFTPQAEHEHTQSVYSAPVSEPVKNDRNRHKTADVNSSSESVEKVHKKTPGKKTKSEQKCIYCKTVFQDNDLFFHCLECLKDGKDSKVCPDCQPSDRPHNLRHINYIKCGQYRIT